VIKYFVSCSLEFYKESATTETTFGNFCVERENPITCMEDVRGVENAYGKELMDKFYNGTGVCVFVRAISWRRFEDAE
jgi:hypothetical protein